MPRMPKSHKVENMVRTPRPHAHKVPEAVDRGGHQARRGTEQGERTPVKNVNISNFGGSAGMNAGEYYWDGEDPPRRRKDTE